MRKFFEKAINGIPILQPISFIFGTESLIHRARCFSCRLRLWLANCYGRGDFTGNRAAQVNWLSLSERIRW